MVGIAVEMGRFHKGKKKEEDKRIAYLCKGLF